MGSKPSNTGDTDSAVAPEGSSNGAETAFVDARVMHAMALERLNASDIRDAAEKAWCATKRATDRLIIARTGQEPDKSPDTTRMLKQLAVDDYAIRQLRPLYSLARDALHGDCFYSGICDPLEETLRLIRETSDYIDKAERLAAAGASV